MLKKQNNAGFTLTEMIIVLAVTSIFFTIVLKIGSMININQELVNQKQAETSEINNILFQLETLIDSSNQKLYKIEILSTTDGFIINSLEDNQIKHSFEFNQNAKVLKVSYDGESINTILLTYVSVIECRKIKENLFEICIQSQNGKTIDKVYRLFN